MNKYPAVYLWETNIQYAISFLPVVIPALLIGLQSGLLVFQDKFDVWQYLKPTMRCLPRFHNSITLFRMQSFHLQCDTILYQKMRYMRQMHLHLLFPRNNRSSL